MLTAVEKISRVTFGCESRAVLQQRARAAVAQPISGDVRPRHGPPHNRNEAPTNS